MIANPFLQWLASLATKALVAGGIMLGLWLYIGHVERAARADQKRQDAAVVREATLQADLAASELARLSEARSAANTKDSNDNLIPEMAAANARLAAHLARLRDKADQGSTVATGLPSTADAAGIIDRADREAVMAVDLRICTENTVRLVNAQLWAAKEYTQ